MNDYVLPEHIYVAQALMNLVKREERWRPNLRMWLQMGPRGRYEWWERIKAQNEKGLPMAQQLVQAVIIQRLKS